MAPRENLNDNTPEPWFNADIPAKKEVIQSSKTELDDLKKTVNPNVEKNIAIIRANFSIEKAQQIIHDIEGIDAQKFPRERRMALSQFLGVLAVAGYHVVFEDGRNVKVLGNAKDLPYKAEIETLLSQFVDGKAQNRNDLKTAIVYRSRSVENFIDSQRDGNLDVDGKDYLFFLLKKYGYRTPTHQPGRSFVNSGLANRVANDKKIPAEDKTFMVSCLKNPYFPGFSLKDELQDYQEMRKVPGFEELKKELLTFDASQNPAGKKPTNNTKRNPALSPQTPADGKNPPFDSTKLPGERGALDNLLNKAGSTPLGAAGPLILIIGAIYALFKYPKVFLAGAAGLGLYAWKPEMFEDALDKAGNKVTNYANREKGPDNSQKPAVNPQSPQTEAAKNNPNKIRSKKEMMYAGFESVDKNMLEGAYSGMLSSKEFSSRPVVELQKAYDKKTLETYFSSIKEIGGTTGAEFYKKYSAVTINGKAENLLELLIGKLLQTRDTQDVITRDLFLDGQDKIKEDEKVKANIASMRSQGMTDLTILFRVFESGYFPISYFKADSTGAFPTKKISLDSVKWTFGKVDDALAGWLSGLSSGTRKWNDYIKGNNNLASLTDTLLEQELKSARDFSALYADKTWAHAKQASDRLKILEEMQTKIKWGGTIDDAILHKYFAVADKMPTFSLFMSANQQKLALEQRVLVESINSKTPLPKEQKAKFEELTKIIVEKGIDHPDTKAAIEKYEDYVQREIIKDEGLRDARLKVEKGRLESFIAEEERLILAERKLSKNLPNPTPELQSRIDDLEKLKKSISQYGNAYKEIEGIKSFDDQAKLYDKYMQNPERANTLTAEKQAEMIVAKQDYWKNNIAHEEGLLATLKVAAGKDKALLREVATLERRLENLKNEAAFANIKIEDSPTLKKANQSYIDQLKKMTATIDATWNPPFAEKIGNSMDFHKENLSDFHAKIERIFPSWTKVTGQLEDFRKTTEAHMKNDPEAWMARLNEETKQQVERNEKAKNIEIKVKDLDADFAKQMSELDNELRAHPEKDAEIRKKVEVLKESTNAKRAALGFEMKEILDLSSDAAKQGIIKRGTFAKGLATLNGLVDSAGNFVSGSKYGRGIFRVAVFGVLGGGVISTIRNGKNGAEVALDLLDMWAGMVPVFGGAYDLIIAAYGKDLNGRDLTGNERLLRAGFGVVGLLPGAGAATKLYFNGAKTVGKWAAAAIRASKAQKVAYGAVEIANLWWKVLTYGALGYQVCELGVAGYHMYQAPNTKISTPQK